jgi:hypothetical protein
MQCTHHKYPTGPTQHASTAKQTGLERSEASSQTRLENRSMACKQQPGCPRQQRRRRRSACANAPALPAPRRRCLLGAARGRVRRAWCAWVHKHHVWADGTEIHRRRRRRPRPRRRGRLGGLGCAGLRRRRGQLRRRQAGLGPPCRRRLAPRRRAERLDVF